MALLATFNYYQSDGSEPQRLFRTQAHGPSGSYKEYVACTEWVSKVSHNMRMGIAPPPEVQSKAAGEKAPEGTRKHPIPAARWPGV